MKKILCVMIAVVIALSSMTILAFADTPNITMTADKTNANAGDVITVTVKVAKNSKLASATLDVVYDADFFQVVENSMVATEAMGSTLNEKFAPNKARYIGTLEKYLKNEANLFSIQFKVLKRGGSISIEAAEVYYIDADLLGERKEVTGDVNNSLKDDVITVPCPHAEKTSSEIQATCATEGRKVDICNECGYVVDTVIPKLPHTPKDIVIKEATCTEAGENAKQCTVCNEIYDKAAVEKLPHDMQDVVIEKETCQKEGKEGKKCTVCGLVTDEKVIPKVEHDMKDTVIEEATCQKDGKEGKKCTMCGLVTDEKVIPKVDHKMKAVVIAAATCETEGKQVEQCEYCELKGEETVIPATGHKAGEWEIVNKPTETAKGLEQKKCTACGKVLESRDIAKYKLGDVNADGYITAVDARYVLQSVAGLVEFNTSKKFAADVNKDGNVTAVDARIILQYVAGLKEI